MTAYTDEFRRHWPALLGAGIGMGTGSALTAMMANLFAPKLIAELGWSKAQFSMGASVSVLMIFFIPLVGRFADRKGARIAATVGFIAVPLGFIAYSLQTGPIYQYFTILLIFQILGVLTTGMVFARVIVDRFERARGMALAIAMSVAPLFGAVLVPIVDFVIETYGWRNAYRFLAAVSAIGGICAVTLIGTRERGVPAEPQARPKPQPLAPGELMALIRQPAFVLLIGGMLILNLPTVMVLSQLKLVLADSGASSHFGTWLISLNVVGTVLGRIICGYALDRAPMHIVAFIALILPAFGFAALASPFDASWVLFASVLTVGLAAGAEGDIGAMIISRKFDIKHYSLVYSFMYGSLSLSAAIGAIMLGVTLAQTGGYGTFLMLASGFTVVASLFFLLIGRVPEHGAPRGVALAEG